MGYSPIKYSLNGLWKALVLFVRMFIFGSAFAAVVCTVGALLRGTAALFRLCDKPVEFSDYINYRKGNDYYYCYILKHLDLI